MSLPVLPVSDGAYVTQNVVDALVRHLEENQPALVAALVASEKIPRDFAFYDASNQIFSYVRDEAGKHLSVPENPVGQFDFLYELSRRARAAAGVGEAPVLGKPLRPGQELPVLPVEEATLRLGVTQAIFDSMIGQVLKTDPQLFRELAEHSRRNMPIWAAESRFRAHWEPLLPSELTLNALIKSRMMMECRKRLRAACGID
jgi:hypothetical protein